MLEHGTTTDPAILGPHPGTRKLHHSNDRPSSTNFRIELLLRRRAVGSTPFEAEGKTERMEGGRIPGSTARLSGKAGLKRSKGIRKRER
jgi:hypothetical protein